MSEERNRVLPWSVARPVCLRITALAFLVIGALAGCKTVADDLPGIKPLGTVTHSEIAVVVSKLFDNPRIWYDLNIHKSVNFGRYDVYSREDYRAVASQVLPMLPDHTDSVFVCVDFTTALSLGMKVAAANSKWKQQNRHLNPPALGWFGVRQKNEFANVPASGGGHALTIYLAATQDGRHEVWVMEAQNLIDVRVAWSDGNGNWTLDETAYPNTPYVREVHLEK